MATMGMVVFPSFVLGQRFIEAVDLQALFGLNTTQQFLDVGRNQSFTIKTYLSVFMGVAGCLSALSIRQSGLASAQRPQKCPI